MELCQSPSVPSVLFRYSFLFLLSLLVDLGPVHRSETEVGEGWRSEVLWRGTPTGLRNKPVQPNGLSGPEGDKMRVSGSRATGLLPFRFEERTPFTFVCPLVPGGTFSVLGSLYLGPRVKG